jgi:hypothetical protein
MTDGQIIKIDEDSLCIAKDGVVFDEIRSEHAKDIIDAFNHQKETISNQDEMIRALIAGQETLGKGIEEKNKEIEGLKLDLQIATQKRVNFFEIIEHFERGRARGIKELAERFKSEVSHIPGWGSVAEKKIDSIVEEISAKAEESEKVEIQKDSKYMQKP